MIVSDSLRLVFLCNPKTGSSSITRALAPYNAVRIEAPLIEIRGWQVHHHYPGTHLHDTFELAMPFLRSRPQYRVATFVRNPWDRVVSFYMFKSKDKDETFLQFVRRFLRGRGGSQKPDIHHSEKQQLEWTRFRDKEAHFVGRFEQIEEEWKRLAGMLGIRHPAPLDHSNDRPDRVLPQRGKPHQHLSERLPWRDYYLAEPRAAALVEAYYEPDIKAFGYTSPLEE